MWHVLPTAGPPDDCIGWRHGEYCARSQHSCGISVWLPGIGQLAWQAALARDLPLLVNVTVLVTLVTLLANSGAM